MTPRMTRPQDSAFTALPSFGVGARIRLRQDLEEDMGLRDILTGMQNGPRGQPQPSTGGSGGGMSPIVIALLGLLAYKAIQGRSGHSASAGGEPARVPPAGGAAPGNSGGSLADVLGGLFGNRTTTAPAGAP